MRIKSLRRKIIFVSSILILSLISCKNSMDVPVEDDLSYITVSTSVKASRSIVPSSSEFSTDNLTDIMLSGSWEGEESVDIFPAKKNQWGDVYGEGPYAVRIGNWEFTLSARLNNVDFSGTTSVAIAKQADDSPLLLEFDLEPTTQTTGGIELSFKIESGSADSATAVLQKDGVAVDTQTLSIELDGTFYTADSLAPGDYDLEIEFKSGSLALNKWSGMVRVLSGFTTKGSIDWALDSVYTIDYDLDDGTQVDTTFVRPNTFTRRSSTITLPELEKTGYVFKGWYDNIEYAGDPLTAIETGSYGDKDLHALFAVPYAKVGESIYTSFTEACAAIKSSSGDISVVLYSSVTASELGSPGTSNKIMSAISSSTADSVSLSVAENNTVTIDSRYAFASCDKLRSIDLKGFDTSALTDMSNMFQQEPDLVEILNISELNTSSVTSMSKMFYNSPSLTTLDLSSFDTGNVTNMGDMFSGCSAITSLDLSTFDTSKVTSMAGMFYGCTSLTSVSLNVSSSVENFAEMFKSCASLASVDLTAFDFSSASNMNDMFDGCTSLTSLDFTNLTKEVSFMNGLFTNCSALTTIYVSEGFVTPGYGTILFQGCTSLVGGAGTTYNSDNISQDYAKIDEGTASPGYFTASNLYAKVAGATCSDLTETVSAIAAATGDFSIILYQKNMTSTDVESVASAIKEKGSDPTSAPNVSLDMSRVTGLAELPYSAFMDCEALYSVKLPEGITEISTQTFRLCEKLAVLTIPSTVTEIVGSAFYRCGALTNVTLASGNTAFTLESDNILYSADKSKIVLYCKKTAAVAITIPASVTEICDYAFESSAITSVDFESSTNLTKIGNSGFDTCENLSVFEMPDSVTSLGLDALHNCTNLVSVKFSSGLTTLETRLCSFCTSLTTVEIPEGITTIKYGAFRVCSSLETITLPSTIAVIGESDSNEVFEDSGLKTVNYRGTETQKDSITIYDTVIVSSEVTWNYLGD